MIVGLGLDQLAQHAVVTAVAVAAAVIVARRVFGVFDRRAAGSGASSTTPAPGCSHCAAGAAAHKKHARS